MTAPEPSRDSRDDRIHELLARCIERIHDGGRTAAAAELAACPELRDEVEAGLDKLERAGLLPLPATAEAIPERLGDFRLVRRLGAGGMGVVFLAVQESLGREVALKLVRPEQLFFPGARERFRREVEAVAKLQDPGIVPILTVGEEAGIPYFAMERVLGASLAEVLAAVHGRQPRTLTGRDFAAAVALRAGVPVVEPLPALFAGSWVTACCRAVQQMALAVQHAHARSVLHRDLKPSNAMVTPAGRVLLLDFGLAATGGASKLTRTGSQPGTLHYMAPEQLAELPLDARTDVYALGVTLHELLTLHPPFDAASGERLRAAILGGVPGSPRIKNPAVGRDVATIVACAIDRDPARRYGSAQALADDLDRALALRPIAARPAGLLLRATRTCQRHPVGTAVGVLLLVGALAAPFVIALARADLGELQRTAAADLEQALAAIRQLRDQATAAELHDTPGFDPVRARQLDAAIAMLQQLRQRHGKKPAVRLSLVTALESAALVRLHLGQHQEAKALLDEAERELAVLLAAEPGKPTLVVRAAAIAMRAGALQVERGETPAAVESFQAAADMLATVTVAADAPLEALLIRGSCLAGLARIRHAAGDLDAAEQLLREAAALDVRALAKSQATDVQVSVVKTSTALASLLRTRGAFEKALAEYERVVQVYAALLAANPKAAELRRELARCRLGIALACRGLGDWPRANAAHVDAQQGFDALVADFADRPIYRRERGMVALAHAETLAPTDPVAAVRIGRGAITSHEELIARLGEPERPESEAELATMVGLVAVWLASTEDDAECEGLFERAAALSARLAAARPGDSYLRTALANARSNLGRHWLASGVPARAIPVLQQAVSDYGEAERLGARLRDERQLPNALLLLAHASAGADRLELAVDALQQRQKVHPELRSAMADLGERLHLTGSAAFQALLATIPQ